jgi:hypothetical protein
MSAPGALIPASQGSGRVHRRTTARASVAQASSRDGGAEALNELAGLDLFGRLVTDTGRWLKSSSVDRGEVEAPWEPRPVERTGCEASHPYWR